MAGQAEPRFGPFILGQPLARRRDLEVHHATYFGPDGVPQQVVLRRARPCADGANDAVLEAARRYAVLRHANVAELVDFGALEGRSYLATQYIRGHNLLRVLGRCGQKKLGFPTDVALYVMQGILRALDHAHRQVDRRGEPIQVTHGDLTHTNVLVSMDGDVKISDFGLALASTRRRTPKGLNLGFGRGYTAYLAPEQVRGEPPTPASDLFQAGVLLYELVTGHVLFSHSHEDPLLERLASGLYPVPLERHRPDLHPDLRDIVVRALAARPEDRFDSARAFLLAIHALVDRVHVQLDALFAQRLMGMLFEKTQAQA
jgi:serine/threonine protein kinase